VAAARAAVGRAVASLGGLEGRVHRGLAHASAPLS
jgi:hypothetical protein